MVRPGRDLLGGNVEVDETYVGGKKPGKRGRGAAGKALVGIAVEDKGKKGLGGFVLFIWKTHRATTLRASYRGSFSRVVQSVLTIG